MPCDFPCNTSGEWEQDNFSNFMELNEELDEEIDFDEWSGFSFLLNDGVITPDIEKQLISAFQRFLDFPKNQRDETIGSYLKSLESMRNLCFA